MRVWWLTFVSLCVCTACGAMCDCGCAHHLQHHAGHVPAAVHVCCHWGSALQGKQGKPLTLLLYLTLFLPALSLKQQWWVFSLKPNADHLKKKTLTVSNQMQTSQQFKFDILKPNGFRKLYHLKIVRIQGDNLKVILWYAWADSVEVVLWKLAKGLFLHEDCIGVERFRADLNCCLCSVMCRASSPCVLTSPSWRRRNASETCFFRFFLF